MAVMHRDDGRAKMKRIISNFVSMLLAIALALFVQHAMWHSSAWWALLGLAGLIPSFLIEGPHGGSHNQVVVGTVLSIIANSSLYFIIIRFLLTRIFRPEPSLSISKS